MKKLLWITAVTCSLTLSANTFANHCRDGLEKMVDSLSIAKDQREKIKPILMQLRTAIHDKNTQMQDIDKQIKTQEGSASMDESVVNGLVDKKAALIGDMMKAKVQAKHQIMGVLNTQQRMAIQHKMEKMETKMAARFANCHNDD